MVSVEKALASRRRAWEVTLGRAAARVRAADLVQRARDDEIAAALRSLRRALRERARAQEAVRAQDRHVGTAMVGLLELGVPVARVAARVGLSATALRKTLRIHVANEPDS